MKLLLILVLLVASSIGHANTFIFGHPRTSSSDMNCKMEDGKSTRRCHWGTLVSYPSVFNPTDPALKVLDVDYRLNAEVKCDFEKEPSKDIFGEYNIGKFRTRLGSNYKHIIATGSMNNLTNPGTHSFRMAISELEINPMIRGDNYLYHGYSTDVNIYFRGFTLKPGKETCKIEITTLSLVDYDPLTVFVDLMKDKIDQSVEYLQQVSRLSVLPTAWIELQRNTYENLRQRIAEIESEIQFLEEYNDLSVEEKFTLRALKDDLDFSSTLKGNLESILEISGSCDDNNQGAQCLNQAEGLRTTILSQINRDIDRLRNIAKYVSSDTKRSRKASDLYKSKLEKFKEKLNATIRGYDEVDDCTKNPDSCADIKFDSRPEYSAHNGNIVKLEMRDNTFSWPGMEWSENPKSPGFWSSKYSDKSKSGSDFKFGNAFHIRGIKGGFYFEKYVEENKYGFATGGFKGVSDSKEIFKISGLSHPGGSALSAKVVLRYSRPEEYDHLGYLEIRKTDLDSGITRVVKRVDSSDTTVINKSYYYEFFFDLSDMHIPENHLVTLRYVLPSNEIEYTLYRAELGGVVCSKEIFQRYEQFCQ